MRSASSVVSAAVMGLFLSTSLLLAEGAGVFVPKEPTQEEQALLTALKEKRVTVSFQETPLRDVAAFLGTLHKINVVAVGGRAAGGEVSMEVNNVSAESAARLLVGPDGGHAVTDNCLCLGSAQDVAVVFSKKARIPENPKEAEIALYGKLKETRLDVFFCEATLADVVNFLRDRTGCNMVILGGPKEADGRTVTLDVRNATLDTILRLVCGLDLSYGIGQEVIYIGTDGAARKVFGAK